MRGTEGKGRREKLGRQQGEREARETGEATKGKGRKEKLGDGTGKEKGSGEREREVIGETGRERE